MSECKNASESSSACSGALDSLLPSLVLFARPVSNGVLQSEPQPECRSFRLHLPDAVPTSRDSLLTLSSVLTLRLKERARSGRRSLTGPGEVALVILFTST